MSKNHPQKPDPKPLPKTTEPSGPTPLPGAKPVWNNLRRLWLIATDAGPAPVDPQPPAPSFAVPPAARVIL